MKAYSIDLRERVAAACELAGRTIGEVAAQFSVSDSFVRTLRRRQRTSGSLAALPARSGPAPCLNVVAQAQLVACLRQQPDATLEELGIWLAAVGGPCVSRATRWRAVQALDWRRKKERPRRRARYPARRSLAGGLCGSYPMPGFYPLQVRG